METENLSERIRGAIKKYLRWYLYPLIYFLATGVVCLYAWYTRPLSHRAGIEVAFKTISLIPTLIWVGLTTVCVAFAAVLYASQIFLRNRFPELSMWKKVEETSQGSDKKSRTSARRKTFNIALSALGIVLVITGLSLAIWISRPYVTLLLSTSKIETLENKAKLEQIAGNRIIIPSALVDAPILEGVSQGQLSRGVCHASQSSSPGEGGNVIIEGHNLAEFGWWKPQSFFSMLEVLDKEAPIYVFYNGKRYVYKVKEKTYKKITDPTLFDFSPGERLTLLTCVSTWSPTIYTNRRTVIVAYPE